jgi:hypothetical protein
MWDLERRPHPSCFFPHYYSPSRPHEEAKAEKILGLFPQENKTAPWAQPAWQTHLGRTNFQLLEQTKRAQKQLVQVRNQIRLEGIKLPS